MTNLTSTAIRMPYKGEAQQVVADVLAEATRRLASTQDDLLDAQDLEKGSCTRSQLEIAFSNLIWSVRENRINREFMDTLRADA